MSNSRPIVALIYDFDNTLSTRDMQEYSIIPSFGMTASDFWDASDSLARQNHMDYILSTMMLMVTKSREAGVPMTRDSLIACGADIQLYQGVEEWFGRINRYGDSVGIEVRHYIISCGMRPMIEGSVIGKEFANIFACDYVYDDNGQPMWPAMAINYSGKIQFLFRINKGIEDIREHTALNMRTHHEDRPVPFTNMIYVGDGLTDIPSMALTRDCGGHSIGVYKDVGDAKYLVQEDRVDFYVPADYRENSKMDRVVRTLIDSININSAVEALSDSINKVAEEE